MAGNDNGWKILIPAAIGACLAWVLKPAPSATDRLRKEGVPFLAGLVRQWRPTGCESESDFQESLHQYLLGQFSEDVQVQKEYGTEKRRADIVVDQCFGIEMKVDVPESGTLDRVDDQVYAIKEQLDGGLLVLCGSVSEEARRRLREKFRESDQTTNELVFDVIRAANPTAS